MYQVFQKDGKIVEFHLSKISTPLTQSPLGPPQKYTTPTTPPTAIDSRAR